MDLAPAAVNRPVLLELMDAYGGVLPLEAELWYDPQDPYAVIALFHTADDTMVRWVFSRDLLGQGLYAPVGCGDVHVWPCLDEEGRAVVVVELSSPDGEALLQISSAEVSEFLSLTEEVVPCGEESRYLDLDLVVAQLLADTPDAV